MFSQMGWEQIGALAEDTQDFPAYHVTLQDYLKLHGINMVVKQNLKAVGSHTDLTQVITDDMFDKIYICLIPSSLLHELAIISVYFIIFKMINFFAFCKQKNPTDKNDLHV